MRTSPRKGRNRRRDYCDEKDLFEDFNKILALQTRGRGISSEINDFGNYIKENIGSYQACEDTFLETLTLEKT